MAQGLKGMQRAMASAQDVANPDLLDRIPLSARVVLDVGCATGALGAAWKRRNPAGRVLGIERDMARAHLAAQVLDEVACVDVEAAPMPFADVQPDCIVYGDVLEHLREPWALLRRHAAALPDGGTVLICMPNVEHWSFAERLLRGTFDYDDQGLFDRTHLRWFSFATTRQALLDAGLVPYDVKPRVFDAPAAEAFVRAAMPTLQALEIDPQSYLDRAAPLQFVWRAHRARPPMLAVLSTMLAPVGGVSDVRVLEPMRALATEPAVSARIVHDTDVPPLPPDAARVFVYHRPLLTGHAGLRSIRRLIDQDLVVVCEFDDHPDFIPVLQRPDVHNFRAVHAIQTSTEALAERLREDNPEVAVFANALAELPEPRNFADPGRLTMFFGGINRDDDWPPYLDALNAVAAAAGPRLRFSIVADRALFDALETPHKQFMPLCDYATYQRLLGACEVSFMPLADTPFNRCKSDLKFIEAAAHRVTALASPVAYGATLRDGQTGLLFRDGAELRERLLRLVGDPLAARGLAEAARAYVAGRRMLAYQTGRRVAWYRSLWDRRAALTEALYARVPDLAGLPDDA